MIVEMQKTCIEYCCISGPSWERIYLKHYLMLFFSLSDDNAYLFTTKFSHYQLEVILEVIQDRERSRLQISKISKVKSLKKTF